MQTGVNLDINMQTGVQTGVNLEKGAILIAAGGPDGASIKLCPDGKIFVNGRLADTDSRVVAELRRLIMAGWRSHG